MNELPALCCAKLLPDAIYPGPWRRAGQPFDTAIEGVTLPLPGRAKASWLVMQLQDLGLVAVHLAVAPG